MAVARAGAVRHSRQRARLERLAVHRKGAAARGAERWRPGANHGVSGADGTRSATRLVAPAAGAAALLCRSERPRGIGGWIRRTVLYATDDASSLPQWN